MNTIYSRHIFNRALQVRAYAFVLLFCVGTSSFYPTPLFGEARQSAACQVADRALGEVTALRGLAPQKKVPCVERTRGDIERFLREMIAEKFPADTLELEQLVYRAIGLLPDDYDYVDGIVKAYVNQIGGYYDPDRKEFVVVEGMQEALHLPIAVHELTHALQDQHFHLTTFLDPTIKNNDQLMARAALVEGDATAVMQDFMRKRGEVATHVLKETIAAQVEIGTSDTSVPDALQKILVFPYIEGLAFVRRVGQGGGFGAIDKAFRIPPSSSRQILHPEEYLAGAPSTDIPILEGLERLSSEDILVYFDSIGEFVVSVLLGDSIEFQESGKLCAQGLRGDRIGVLESKDHRRYVSWRSEWDSTRDAREFTRCYQDMIRRRYNKNISADLVALTDSKRAKLLNSGRVVSLVVEVE